MSIKDDLGGNLYMLVDGGAFFLAMTGIGAGLAAFGIGSILNSFTSDDFGKKIKTNVLDLLSIPDEVEGDIQEKAAKVNNAMGSLSAGLMKFSGGSFVSSLANAATGILNFFTGGESPIDQMLKLADKDAEIASTERNIDRMVDTLGRFSSLNLTGPTIDFTKLMRGVADAIPFIQALGGTHPDQEGGTKSVKVGTYGSRIEIGPQGILDEALKIEDISAKIAQVQGALGYNVNVSPTASSSTMGNQVTEMSNEQAGTQAPVVVNQVDASVTDASVKSSSSNAIVGDPSPAVDTLGGNRLSYA